MYIGIDLGGTNIAAGVVDETGRIIYKSSVPTLAQRPVEEIVEDMANLCIDVVNGADRQISEIKSIGIGCPGTVDNKNGIVAYACNIRMKNTELGAMLEKRLGKRINLENDANAAALGEYAVNGDKGCWEAYASVTALIRQTKQAMQADISSMMHKWVQENGEVSGRTAFDCAKVGDKTAAAVVAQYIRYVGMGLISILNIFQPSKILIGGGISKEGDYLLNPLREYVYAGDYNKYREKTKIAVATLFNDAGIIGAALSAKE